MGARSKRAPFPLRAFEHCVSCHSMTPADADWPAPVEVLNEEGASPIVLLCPHASNRIPAEYGNLGLPQAELQRHIAWDIGAAGLTRQLSCLIDAPAYLGTYSRLLIDLNRPPDSASSIVTRSEATDVPGNLALPGDERDRRIKRIFDPYHRAVEQHLADRLAARRPIVIVAIHSFTPVYHDVPRPTHVGVLFEKSVQFADAVIETLRTRHPDLNVGANVP